MEINAEMNKIFGQEMAKLFAATISEDELKLRTQQVWKEMIKKDSYPYNSNSEIEKYIKDQILARLYEKINELLKEPINEEALEKKAREMVDKARRAGEEAIIKDMAKHMADNMLSIYGRDDDIMARVLAEMNLRQEKNKYY